MNIDWNDYEAILRFRRDVEEGTGKFGKLPEGIMVSPVDIDNMPAEWIFPTAAYQCKEHNLGSDSHPISC